MENKGTLIAIGVLIALVALIVVIAIIDPLVIVGAGQRGVVMDWGAVSDNVSSWLLHSKFAEDFKKDVVDELLKEIEKSDK